MTSFCQCLSLFGLSTQQEAGKTQSNIDYVAEYIVGIRFDREKGIFLFSLTCSPSV